MQRTAWLAASLMLAIGGWLGSVEPASACSPPLPAFINGVKSAPANGVVVIETSDYVPADIAQSIVLAELRNGTAITGELVYQAYEEPGVNVLAFLPDEPLTAGARYEVSWPAAAFQFEATPALSWSLDDIRASAVIELLDDVDSGISCWSSTGACEAPYVPLTRRPYLAIAPSIDLSSVARAEGQFLISFKAWLGAATEPVQEPSSTIRPGGRAVHLDAIADTYCYRVELTSLVDGSKAAHEACIDDTIGEPGALLSVPVSDREIAAGIAACRALPADELAPLCHGSSAECGWGTGSGDDQRCAVLASICAERRVMR